MKKDLTNRKDIDAVVEIFYRKIQNDALLAPYFTTVVKVNWEHHMPLIGSFWENILFHSGNYAGNPMQIHRNIHALAPLNSKHFSQWVKLFSETVDDLYSGENAELLKQRAASIAMVMQSNILQKRQAQ